MCSLSIILFLFLLFVLRSSTRILPPTECRHDLEQFAPGRVAHDVVIAIFTGENDGGYKSARLSTKSYFQRRDGIRKTWKAVEAVEANITMFFLLSDYNLTDSQRQEMKTFRDILLVRDPSGDAWGYHGLSTKLLLLVQLIAQQCTAVKYLMKCDDDTYVHIPRLALFASVTHGERIYAGIQLCKLPVKPRGHANLNFIANTGLGVFPCFMQGGGYLLSGDVVNALGTLTHLIPLHRYDDVEDLTMALWLTGWNLTQFNVRSAGLGFEIEGSKDKHIKDRYASVLCNDRWLFVHRVFCGQFHTFYHRICGPAGQTWADAQRNTSGLLPYVPRALLRQESMKSS
eukprot:EG_transcript_11354